MSQTVKRKFIERREKSASQITIKEFSRTSGSAQNAELQYLLPAPVGDRGMERGGRAQDAFQFGANGFRFVGRRVSKNDHMFVPFCMRQNNNRRDPFLQKELGGIFATICPCSAEFDLCFVRYAFSAAFSRYYYLFRIMSRVPFRVGYANPKWSRTDIQPRISPLPNQRSWGLYFDQRVQGLDVEKQSGVRNAKESKAKFMHIALGIESPILVMCFATITCHMSGAPTTIIALRK
jgi:hypothetical protein